MPTEGFIKQYGVAAMKAAGEGLSAKTKDLMLHICEHIKISNLLVGTLSIKNLTGLSQCLEQNYEVPELLKAIKYVPNAYATIDKKMIVEISEYELYFHHE